MDSAATQFYGQLLDSLHFYLLHLFECGFRTERANLNHINDRKQAAAEAFSRVLVADNNKFNLHCVEAPCVEEETFTSAMISQSFPDTRSRDLVHRFRVFLEQEEYDTDSIIYDITLLSNIANIIHDEELLQNMQLFIMNHTSTSTSFSIGLIFYYWPYYKNYNDKNQLQMKTNWANVNDHGGYAIGELFVEKKHASLKEELLACKYVSKLTYKRISYKARQHIHSHHVKQTKAAGGDWMRFCKFDIEEGTSLSIENLMCLITYCDYTELCTEFKSTFRSTKRFESLTEIKQRNREYWWLSKILRETVQVFGNNKEGRDYGSKWRNVTGPFYCGMSFVMAIPEFNIRLCAPTSTSTVRAIATKFTQGKQGMIIRVNNNGDALSARYLRCFQCAWISRFKEEAECLFFGGDYRIRIESIMVMRTRENFRKPLESLFYFDAMINGSDPLGSDYNKISENDISRLKKLIDIECRDSGVSDHQMQEYIVDTFHLFCLKKTQIIINLCFMDYYFKALHHLIMNPIERGAGHWLDDMSSKNLFKPIIFTLFRNLKEIIIYTTASMLDDKHAYSFSLIALFNLISERSIKMRIKIFAKPKNTEQFSWLFDAYYGDFTFELKSLFAEKGWKAQHKTVRNEKGEKEDCVVMDNHHVYRASSCVSLLSTSPSVASLSPSTNNLLTHRLVGGFNVVPRRQHVGCYRASFQFAQYPPSLTQHHRL
eukprot:237425_1